MEDIKSKTNATPPLSPSDPDNIATNVRKAVADLMTRNNSALWQTVEQEKLDDSARKVFVMRHGERCDFTFGNWERVSFDSNGKYTQKDLNMPDCLPTRNLHGWIKDSPLTKIGLYQTRLTGEYIKSMTATISAVYCSPAYRTVQTAQSFLDGLGGGGGDIPIFIEPGLFEWLAWYQDELPEFVRPWQLKEFGFNVDTTYEPYLSYEQMADHVNETLPEFYERNAKIAAEIVGTRKDNVLLVGHAQTLDTCSRFLLGKGLRSPSEMGTTMRQVSFSSFIGLREYEAGKWKLIDQASLPCTHMNNSRFNYKLFE